jgi:fatty-acyl-CoA synthase
MSLGDLLRERGESAAAGITFDDGYVSYAELVARAHGASAALRAHGVEPGDSVAMLLESRPQSVVAALGAWLAGATVMSFPPPPRERVGGETAFYCRGLEGVLADSFLVGPVELGDALACEALDPGAVDVGPGPDLGIESAPTALVQFTSGSTGAPKGVVISEQALVGHIDTIVGAIDLDSERDVAVSWLPLYHDMGLIGFLGSALRNGLPLVLTHPRTFARNPRRWLEMCAEHRGTVTCAPDFAYRMTAAVLGASPQPVGDLSSLRICMSGAERASWSTIERFVHATAPAGLDPRSLMPVYGLAEATLAVTFPELGRGPRANADGHVALGRALPDIEMRVREGRVELRGPHMFSGYLTSGGFERPFDEDGWFLTNDAAELDESGELYVHGRTDEAIISRGRNVFAEDVELIATLSDGILPLGVAAFRSPCGAPRFGLAMEVVASPDVDLDHVARSVQSAITRSLGVRVSPVVFLAPKALPRTTSGKVRRGQCRDALQQDTWPAGAVLASVA